MSEAGFPLVSKELVEKLEELFPPQCIGENQSFDNAHRYAGMVFIVQFLRNQYEKQVDVPR